MSFDQPARPLRRALRRLALAAVAALALAPMVVVASAAPASANTNSFRGFNWAQLGDNYTDGLLVVQGLSSSDSYDTVRAKANALYDDMESTVGANTVRLPINPYSVGTAWWNSYTGAIDAATARLQGHPRLLGGHRAQGRPGRQPLRLVVDVGHRHGEVRLQQPGLLRADERAVRLQLQ